ncbi:transmembrane protein 6/97 [Chlamydoabsidia padenii]|nr:transmembrane protein 6/97 [Chlamydoabsidia padenii]
MSTFTGRPLDFVFFIFFITHIPITLLLDLQAIYPTWLVPSVLLQANAWYVNLTHDPFMGATSPIYWFQSFVSLEAICQLPFFFVASHGLYYDQSFIRLPMIVYGAHVVTTVVPLLGELILNPLHVNRVMLLAIYSPYFLIPLLILVDSYRRVSSALTPKIKPN